jgi:uncharacterized protein
VRQRMSGEAASWEWGCRSAKVAIQCQSVSSSADDRRGLRALVISDTRPNLESRTLAEFVSENAIDLVITAGDLHRSDLDGVDRLAVPAIGVYGNHCDGRYLEDLGMRNLHLSKVAVGGITFTGLQGCVRYKDGTKDLLYTQSEYANLVYHLPTAEVLVTHCPPAGINDHPRDPAHVGINALRHWVDTTAPHLVIHGHTYPKAPLTVHGTTRIEYVYGAKILSL